MGAPARDLFSEKLRSLGFTDAELATAAENINNQKISFVQALESLGRINSRVLIDALGPLYGCPVVHLEDRDIAANIIDLIPKDLASKLRIIPIERSANNLIVATGNPKSPEALKAIQSKTKFFPRTVLASELRISDALQKYYS